MMKKETIKDMLLVIMGNLLLAVGVTVFILPNDVLTGGVTGIAVALQPLIHVEPTIMINVLTIALFFVGLLFLGKRFALKTLASTIFYPVLISLLSWIIAAYFPKDYFVMDRYLATIYGGMTDALTVMLGVATYGFQAALIGILSVFISSISIDKMLTLGAIKSKNCMIISERYEEMLAYIHQELYRGTTILSGHGGYTHENRPVIMVVVSKKQYPLLEHEVLKVDPNAFIIVTDTDEVHGLGFTYEDEDF